MTARPEAEPRLGPLFFKSCWTECSRIIEPHIIETAHRRAKMHLPSKYCDMVSLHIPEVVSYRKDDRESTSIIRLLMMKSGAVFAKLRLKDIKNRARVRVIMITRRLDILEELDPVDFWRCFWDCIRCTCALTFEE